MTFLNFLLITISKLYSFVIFLTLMQT